MMLQTVKYSHKKEELELECQAIPEAGDVLVSGHMLNNAGKGSVGPIVLVDRWFKVTESKDAPAT